MKRQRSERSVVVLALALLLLLPHAVRAESVTSEYQLKAAFLFKFPGYIDWPPTAFDAVDSPLVFGVLASDAMLAGLQQIAESQKTINGRSIRIRRLQPEDPLTAINVLFVGRELGARAGPLLQQAVNGSILTVTEANGPITGDSMINFAVSDNRVKFDIALAPAQRAGLGFSARLLQVAQRVIDKR